MNGSSRTLAALALAGLAAAVACGRKADPQPYALVQPEPITGLQAAIRDDGVRLAWERPEDYASGRRMDDLGGFFVFRGLPGQPAERIAEIPVTDRERFQREKKFEHVDRAAQRGRTYYYRIVSYTTDGYFSEPSNQVTVEIAP